MRFRQVLRTLPAALVGLLLLGASVSRSAPLEGFADVVAKVRPAVVNIAAMHGGRTQPPSGFPDAGPEQVGTPSDDLLRQFLDPFGSAGNNDSQGTSASLGSGFIIDPSGLVVTSAHVIQGADRVHVTLTDGRRFTSVVVGRDDETDVALLQIDARLPLPFVAWGDSDAARVGDWVIAVGNPFGLGGTVTAGIISARGRDIQSGRFDDYLQIDASINRGNSGGPSFDLAGGVIGINSVIYSTGGGSIGIGFATPSSLARPVVDELRRHGRVARGWLGVSIQAVTRGIADSLGLREDRGALVTSVVRSGPAAKAGIQQGDIVLAADGQLIGNFRDLTRLVVAAGPGAGVVLKVWRDGAERVLPVSLEIGPAASATPVPPPSPRADQAADAALGLSLLPINRETRQWFGIPDEIQGALVVDAPRVTGLAPGDIITKIGNRPVNDPRDVVDGVDAARQAGRGAALLLILRMGVERFVAVPMT